MRALAELIAGGIAQLFSISFTLIVASLHFARGGESVLYGCVTLSIFCLAGWITNWFNYARHEVNRQAQRPAYKRVLIILRNFFPGYSILSWHLEWLRSPSSWSAEYWVSVLRLFHGTLGDLPQAILQTYLIIRLWWEKNIEVWDFNMLIVLSCVSASMVVFSVCSYIRKEHFEEEHRWPKNKDFLVVVIATILNLGGRVTSLAMVGNVFSGWWMTGGFAFILSFNYFISLHISARGKGGEGSCAEKIFYTIPLASLYALSMTRKRGLMVLNTMLWLCLSLPQLAFYNERLLQWVLFGVPFLAQIVALLLLLCKWRVVEVAFRRFERLEERPVNERIRRGREKGQERETTTNETEGEISQLIKKEGEIQDST
ncbi:uncharacterized protein LOC125026520 [Penaeus chinensis]|uniref:uncharacterized protein LOC125026520 n=1 Tax=Penaeus chinensis TaxID=139456 RepID=UPI001FB6AB5A|nr:uncharacterized protein LOC125026520 [Penaeus chinensis]